ncbi:hypothetical protein [Halioxenophilus sp. WMMB6]|uniref:hypothetical protein n=1 Tax=Halioxenophilus sp. WMMB6 TaxID=3073815 RepID=UPI00295EE153|nr:hypothetical protein [Halioxenophilus sp. WMMB6]
MSERFQLSGEPSDAVDAIVTCGDSGISHLFLSMAARHPEGKDAEYLHWHSVDHRPEQMRLASIRASLRVVSTPRCRAVRAACSPAYEAIDHVMTYFFANLDGLDEFNRLSEALRDAGRSPFILPPVERGVYAVSKRQAAARAKLGADVLPWLPTLGVYLLLEEGREDAAGELAPLLAVPGVAGSWQAGAVATAFSTAPTSQTISLLFLDADPVAVAERLQPVLAERWRGGDVTAQLAAPFYTLVPYEWHLHLP